VNFDEIQQLIRLVAETGLGEVEVKRSGVYLRICSYRSADAAALGTTVVSSMAPDAAAAAVASPARRLAAPAAAPPPPAPAPDDEAGLHLITATMVGTFYRRPNPEAAAFVKEGDSVRKGQVVCLLEAMKILNEIESDVGGTVVKVHAEDAQPVEFGEKLFSIRLA
jgi:acetyl-CoA carboxylase biotin carboxyl carrier protein